MTVAEAARRTRQVKAFLVESGHIEHVEKVWTRTDRDDHPERPYGTVHTYRSVVTVAALCCPDAYSTVRDALDGLPDVDRVTEARRHDAVANYDAVIVWWRGWTEPS